MANNGWPARIYYSDRTCDQLHREQDMHLELLNDHLRKRGLFAQSSGFSINKTHYLAFLIIDDTVREGPIKVPTNYHGYPVFYKWRSATGLHQIDGTT